ncbi:MAG: nitrite reductase/ring-hydroxylating ferredoxin subunit/alkylhydroperoxidase [Planctomycetota bacterium]|jgi:nitrite reductase/ring-hydroxylating ferredoxin subunit/alkylhydroperoxidase/carboxymuconolactone decarboxylase family protein YurZ
MSDALKYLMQVRPEAMENYFSFLKKSGEHLDEKTRAIISVITKVDKQTDRGFRQYLKRALHVGVTANEIIDAMFVAFPTLGLSKIIWAVDILLDMDVPEFQLENIQDSADWHNVMEESELKRGANFIENCDGRDLYVYKDKVNISVYDSRCPHQATAIPESGLRGLKLTCPLHEWRFDLKTGACVDKGDKPLSVFNSKIENGRLLAFW